MSWLAEGSAPGLGNVSAAMPELVGVTLEHLFTTTHFDAIITLKVSQKIQP